MATKNAGKLASVTCPACQGSARPSRWFHPGDYVLNENGACKYCDGTGHVDELAEAQYEIAQLQIERTQMLAEMAALRALLRKVA